MSVIGVVVDLGELEKMRSICLSAYWPNRLYIFTGPTGYGKTYFIFNLIEKEYKKHPTLQWNKIYHIKIGSDMETMFGSLNQKESYFNEYRSSHKY